MSMLESMADQGTAAPRYVAVASPRAWSFYASSGHFHKRKKFCLRRKPHRKVLGANTYTRYCGALTVSAAVFSPWCRTQLSNTQSGADFILLGLDVAPTASESFSLGDTVYGWPRTSCRSLRFLAQNHRARATAWKVSKFIPAQDYSLPRSPWCTASQLSCASLANGVGVDSPDNPLLTQDGFNPPPSFALSAVENGDSLISGTQHHSLTDKSDSVSVKSVFVPRKNGHVYNGKDGLAEGFKLLPGTTGMQNSPITPSQALESRFARNPPLPQPRPNSSLTSGQSTQPNSSESLDVNDTVIIPRGVPKSPFSNTLSFVPNTKHSLFRLAGKKHFRRPHLCEDTGFLAEFDIASQQKNEFLPSTTVPGGSRLQSGLDNTTSEPKNKTVVSVTENGSANNNSASEKSLQTSKQHASNKAYAASGTVAKLLQPGVQRHKGLMNESLRYGINATTRHNRVQLAMIFDGHGPQVSSNPKNGTQLFDEAYISPGKLIAEHSMRNTLEAVCLRLKELLAAPLLPSNHSLFLKKSRQAIFSETFNDAQRQLLKTLPPQTLWEAGTTGTIVLASSVKDREKNPRGLVEVMCCNMGDSRAVAITFKRQKFSAHASHGNATLLASPLQQGAQLTGTTFSLVRPSVEYFVPESLIQLSTEENIRHLSEQRKVIERLLRAGFVPLPIPKQNSSTPKRNRLLAAFVPRQFWPAESSIRPKQFTTLQDVKTFVENQVATWSAHQSNPPPLNIFTAFCIVGSYVYRVFYNPHTDRITIKGLQLTASLGDRYLEPVKQASRDASNVSVTHLVNDESHTTLVITASDGLWGAVDRIDPSGFSLASFLAYHLTVAEAGGQKEKTASLAEILSMWAGKRISDDVTISVLVYPNMKVLNASEPQHTSPTS